MRSADSKIGDFHLTVSELVNGEYYKEATFDEIVNVLDNIYVSKESCSVQSITRDLLKGTDPFLGGDFLFMDRSC